MPDTIVALWANSGQSQVIFQAELLPVLVARLLWSAELADRPNLTFVDNDSARHALVKGYSQVVVSARIVDAVWLAEAGLGALSWFARVPSASNIADGPSRLAFHEVEALPASRVRLTEALWGQIMGQVARD